MPALTSAQIAEICAGTLHGIADVIITAANTLEEATESDVAFVASDRAGQKAGESKAGCLIVPPDFQQADGRTVVFANDPRKAFVRVLHALYARSRRSSFRHPTAQVAASALISENVWLGPYVTVGERTKVGPDCVIGSHCSVGDDVLIGAGTELCAHVVVYSRVVIGADCLIHSGCVIGADGFGFAFDKDRYEKFPQVGTVIIGDSVEIGANSCIDRAALGRTAIGDGTKIDNLVHIAHNCQIGRHVVIAAQTGFSGSVNVGDYAVIGGQVGVGERARIEAKAVVGSQGGILPGRRVPAGEPVWGTPARPLRQHLRSLAYVNRLGELNEAVKRLAQTIEKLRPLGAGRSSFNKESRDSQESDSREQP